MNDTDFAPLHLEADMVNYLMPRPTGAVFTSTPLEGGRLAVWYFFNGTVTVKGLVPKGPHQWHEAFLWVLEDPSDDELNEAMGNAALEVNTFPPY